MKSRMKPKYYTSEDHFKIEQELIFRKIWMFAGFKSSVSSNNQFFTKTIGGIPIVVQNFDGTIRAFVNSCSHRGAKLQREEFGCRPLICQYHGWKYDSEGYVSSMPFEKKYYKYPKEERERIAAKKIHLKVVGEFIFVNFDENPILINKQFHPALLLSLIEMSKHIDTEMIYSKKLGCYNWKLPFENLNDSLHPFFVHPQTISQQVDFEGSGFYANEIINLDGVQLLDLSYSESVGEFKQEKRHHFYDYVERFGSSDRYYNWLIYPNLHIASTDGGYTFTFEYYHPISAAKTELQSFWCTAKKKKNYSASSAVLWEFMRTSRYVLDEDSDIMELTQAGFNINSPDILLGAYEEQNKRMEMWYTRQLEAYL